MVTKLTSALTEGQENEVCGFSDISERLVDLNVLIHIDWLQSLKQFFINVSYRILVAGLTLMALFCNNRKCKKN